MIAARPVISPTDQRYYHIHYPWLLDNEVITSCNVTINNPPSDLVGLFTLSGAIDVGDTAIILKSNVSLGPEPPVEGTEYVVDISVMTTIGDPIDDKHQVNTDQLIFIIDEGAY